MRACILQHQVFAEGVILVFLLLILVIKRLVVWIYKVFLLRLTSEYARVSFDLLVLKRQSICSLCSCYVLGVVLVYVVVLRLLVMIRFGL